ncbi:MAG: chemotaxis protein CheW [Alphaproteobacteria bacterium]|nr:chemotaxis protein CheW [Alphaproteobacteria bacterium]
MASVATRSDTTIVGENEEQLVTMIVDNQLFGIPILQVQDIVEASKITPVPLAPSAIAGVLNLRGRIVTVIDLRKLLGNNDEVPWDSQMGVTVEYKGDLYTLLVDAIGDVRTLPKRDFDSAPSTMDSKVRKLCSGIFRLRGNLLVVLDVSRILLPDVIEATPKLSVEDRRQRKDAAQAESDANRTDKGRQLSALMTDLNAYETDFDSGLDSIAADSDDIKARKKANRDRRPVSERWREVLDEKARREGSTVYRMREPKEEVLEDAREDAEKQQAAWEAELQARQSDTYESRLADARGARDYDQPASAEEANPTDFDAVDSASDEPVAADFDMPVLASDDPVSEVSGMDYVGSDEPAATDFDMLDQVSDEAAPVEEDVTDLVADEAAPVEEDVTDLVADEAAPVEEDVTDLVADEAAPAEEDVIDLVADELPPVEEEVTDLVADEVVPAEEDVIDLVADEAPPADLATPDLTAVDPDDLDELPTSDETVDESEAPSESTSWWSKMRGKKADAVKDDAGDAEKKPKKKAKSTSKPKKK